MNTNVMPRMRQKEKAEMANTKDESSKTTGLTPNEDLPAKTLDEYQCTGNVEIDFPRLCALLDMKDIPAVSTRGQGSSNTETALSQSQIWKPRLQVELKTEDPFSAKDLKVSGWKVNDQIALVLQKMLPFLSKLQSLQFWQARLTDEKIISLMNTISLCSSLRHVKLEGNPLPEQSYHLLLSEDSVLNHLFLRNNRMGDEGARLIGLALSTTRSANKNLYTLDLSFNSIGDAGAKHIAQGLRFNRTLTILSLSNNHIGDAGVAHLAATLGEFALTHEEVVERRKLLWETRQSSLQSSFVVDSNRSPADQLPSVLSIPSLSSSKGKKKETDKKGEKPASNKDNQKPSKKPSDVKGPQSKGSKPGGKEKRVPAMEEKSSTILAEAEETVNPLLDKSVQARDGEIFLPGNTALLSLDLSGNRITEKTLPLFLKSLKWQSEVERGGLIRFPLQRNHFPSNCESNVKIKELIELAFELLFDSENQEEEGQAAL
ncbi:leucine-rich repeat-containing protein 71 isoform X2 [Notolabrus celidotus]|uniref:leucine-rich repeat-containing protein 71 isoform X2 n=1 Tax=Notolabrus celidotus TaxID=1203425 RepID=UPI00148FE7F4|nr:leucine-rich repeat-containing protein 71 isoform X2 [Notolabrus celidotus]